MEWVAGIVWNSQEIGEGLWRMYFRQKMLGYFDEATLRLQDERGRLKRNNV